MKIKVSEATNRQINHMVAMCEGGLYQEKSVRKSFWIWPGDPVRYSSEAPDYCGDPSKAYPIILNHGIDTLMEQRDLKVWAAEIYHSPKGYVRQRGNSPLQAAMKVYVVSKLGDEVEVSDELH